MKKIYVECTHTYDTDLNTGIQRVVRNLLRFLPSIASGHEIEIIPVVLIGGRLLPTAELPPPVLPHQTKPNRSHRIKNYLKNLYRALRALIVALFPFPALERFLFAPRTVFGLNWMIDQTLFWPLRWFSPSVNVPLPPQQRIREESILLLLDSSWHLPIWDAVDEMIQNGSRVFAVTYDLIPISHPNFCDETLVHLFNNWFEQASRRVEGYIAISQTVRDDLRRYMSTLDPSVQLPQSRFGYFHLGADVKEASTDEKEVRPMLKEWLASGPAPYLIVCTIEPRKNHAYLLEVFEHLWDQGIDARLMIVGRIGWKVDKLIEGIRTHREFTRRLSMWNDLDDNELSYVYTNAKMLLFPSFVEGFGLPIVESLRHGLPVMASDIPVHREVGKERIGYFDLSDPYDLMGKLSIIESSGAVPRVDPSQTHIVDWRQSAQSLLDEIIRLEGKSDA